MLKLFTVSKYEEAVYSGVGSLMLKLCAASTLEVQRCGQSGEVAACI